MADYVLEPGEHECHTHDRVTTTELIHGEVCFEMNGTTRELKLGEVVEVPANMQHKVTNTGKTQALVACVC